MLDPMPAQPDGNPVDSPARSPRLGWDAAWPWFPWAALLMVLAVFVLCVWLGEPAMVRGSTEAWIMAHVRQVLLTGDYAAATGASMVPNTTWNAAYPALVAWLARAGLGSPIFLGHVVSAAALGLAGAALSRCWWLAGGPATASAGGLAVLFPPMVITASMARYDALALALALCVAWAALEALRRDGFATWILAGAAAGLAYNTREFVVLPAVGCLAAALLIAAVQRESSYVGAHRVLRWLLRLLLALAGLAGGAALLPLALGLSPLSGYHALLGYGVYNQFGDPPPLPVLLYLDRFWIPFGLGALGLLVASIHPGRGGDRRAPLLLLAMLLPFAGFVFSRQQSPQYYLLAHVLLLSGVAGLLTLLPRHWLRLVALLVIAAPVWPWTARQVQENLGRKAMDSGLLHSEAWPADLGEPERVVAWAVQEAETRPLILVSGTIENIDALGTLEHGRPIAFLFREWLDRLPEAIALFQGQDALVVSVEANHLPANEVPGGVRLDRLETEHLLAELWVVPGKRAAPTREPPCARGGKIRGACLQLAWLEGGEDGVRQRILSLRQHYRGLQGWRSMWW